MTSRIRHGGTDQFSDLGDAASLDALGWDGYNARGTGRRSGLGRVVPEVAE